MTAKIDTQAPERIWATDDDIRDRCLGIDPATQGMAPAAEYLLRDLADARAAAAAQAMREAAVAICQKEQAWRESQEEDQSITDGGWQKERFRVGAQQSRQLAEKIAALPLLDAAALDRLIAERVREAVEAALDAVHEADSLELAQHGTAKIAERIEAQIAARGSKEGQS